MKDRVIETEDGQFYPQHKPGFFWFWKFYAHDADTSVFMLERLILTADPGRAAHFASEAEALAFIARVDAKADAYWAEQRDAFQREIHGVAVKRVIKPPVASPAKPASPSASPP